MIERVSGKTSMRRGRKRTRTRRRPAFPISGEPIRGCGRMEGNDSDPHKVVRRRRAPRAHRRILRKRRPFRETPRTIDVIWLRKDARRDRQPHRPEKARQAQRLNSTRP